MQIISICRPIFSVNFVRLVQRYPYILDDISDMKLNDTFYRITISYRFLSPIVRLLYLRCLFRVNFVF